jgi:hypothetical protein
MPTDPEKGDHQPFSPISHTPDQQSFLLPDANHNNQVIKPAALRTTCEGCRKLKIRCVPIANGGGCEKCQKKGAPCIFQPRAPYTTRKKKE